MTREEVAAFIKKELVGNNLVKDPVVTVEFMNLTVSVMGEVAHPGQYSIDKDNVTVLDALSMAGDLTIYGKREKYWCSVRRTANSAYTASTCVRASISIPLRCTIFSRGMWSMSNRTACVPVSPR